MKLRERIREWLARHPRAARCLAKARHHRRRLIALTIFLFHIAGALTSIRAIMEVRTAQGAVAWVISLNTFPYAAVPAY